MAVAKPGLGHYEEYSKRAAEDYSYNGHGFGDNTDCNMRQYEDQHFGSFGLYGVHEKKINEYCSTNPCITEYPR